MSDQLLLILVIGAALMYDFVNGFHDAANAIATTVVTHSLSPRQAIVMARTLNFIGGLLHTAVAYTIGKGVVDSSIVTLPLLFGAVVGAVLWGYFTWYFGLPSSSTHALIGGLVGVALYVSNFNPDVLIWNGIWKVVIAMVFAPFIGAAFCHVAKSDFQLGGLEASLSKNRGDIQETSSAVGSVCLTRSRDE